MDVFVTDKLVSVVDGTIVGYLVSAGGQYKIAVTKGFGEMQGVNDIDIADFLDVPTVGVVPIYPSSYAVHDKNIGFMEDLRDTPSEVLGDTKVFYGWMFRDQHIVPLDSQAAYARMILEAKGGLVE